MEKKLGTLIQNYAAKVKQQSKVSSFLQVANLITPPTEVINEILDIVENTRLTAKEYKEAKELVNELAREARRIYKEALQDVEIDFKRNLFHDFDIKNYRLGNIIYQYAYAEADSHTYDAIYDKFEHYFDFLEEVKDEI